MRLPRTPVNEPASRCWISRLHGLVLPFLIAVPLAAADRAETHNVTAVRFWSLGEVTRIAVESDGDFTVRSDRLENPDRLFFDLIGTKPKLGEKGMTTIPVSDAL